MIVDGVIFDSDDLFVVSQALWVEDSLSLADMIGFAESVARSS